MREKLSIPEDQLVARLRDKYAILPEALDFLPLGLDTQAALYRVTGNDDRQYCLKVKSGSFYAPSCRVPRYLADQGITAVVAPLATKRNELWARLGEWTLVVYPFIEGLSGFYDPMTDEQWQSLGQSLRQIHEVRPPASLSRELRRERFDTSEYAQAVGAIEEAQTNNIAVNTYEQQLQALWEAHRQAIHRLLAGMEKLAALLQAYSGPAIICHADLHPGNLIRAESGAVHIIDWDDVMLAPKERDFLFVQEPQAGSHSSPFFEGYGEAEIDQVALTYYRCERVLQDLIVCAQEVLFRSDLNAATKADAIRLFEDILAVGGEYDTAKATAAQLPADVAALIII